MIRKSILASKTFWVQALALVAALLPPVQAWLASNPVEFVAALAAVNVLVRFITHGKVSIFPDGPDKPAGPNALGVLACLLLAGGLLTGCAEYPVRGSISYRDAKTGAKGGLVFAPGAPVAADLRVPIYDKDSGKLIGVAAMSASLPAVDRTSGK